MNDERPPDERTGEEADDLGAPIEELDRLRFRTSSGFLRRVRNRVERRRVTNHFVASSWDLPRIVLLEFLGLTFRFAELFTGAKGDRK